MCGICGWFRPVDADVPEPTPEDRSVLLRMTRTLRHRGPDDEGLYLDRWAGLGFRRLSIIDLAGGHQPMPNEDRTVWVIFNGEIYNFRELRTELEQRGHMFRTRADTEVIVHGYEEWGPAVVDRLRGMFAFALWDTRRRQALLARDPIGIKPLYYALLADGTLVFGSELKALLMHPGVSRRLNPVALDAYLTVEYIPAPATLLQDVFKLPAGHRLLYRNGHATVQMYWDVPPEVDPPADATAACEALRDHLQDAVVSHTVSDVPIGTFLSGGMDSSTVVAMLTQAGVRPLRTFSIGFDDPTYNELPYARQVAHRFRTDHTETILSYDIVRTVDHLLTFLDEPLGDFSIFPTYLVSRTARAHVKVILSGDGGDEVFAGYEHYIAWRIHTWLRLLPPSLRYRIGIRVQQWVPPARQKKGIRNRLRRFAEGWLYPDTWGHLRWMMFLPPSAKAELYTPDLHAWLNGRGVHTLFAPYLERARQFRDPINRMLYLDLKTYLAEDILTKVDRMSMAVSLETRVPLLDRYLVEWVFRLPGQWKLHGLTTKWILKRAMAPILPRAILHREKQGFSIPMKNWLRNELRPLLLDILTPDTVRATGLFQWPIIARWIDEHLSERADHAHRLWALLLFHVWYQHMRVAHPWQLSESVASPRA